MEEKIVHFLYIKIEIQFPLNFYLFIIKKLLKIKYFLHLLGLKLQNQLHEMQPIEAKGAPQFSYYFEFWFIEFYLKILLKMQ